MRFTLSFKKIKEGYLARSNGLQRVFTLAEPLRHEGDLVIRGQLVTLLEPE